MGEEDQQWWYNTRTGSVERGAQSPAVDRAGPFRTAADAAKAPDKIRQNSERWAADDAAEDR